MESKPVTFEIYIAGNAEDAKRFCRRFCKIGLCVTVTETAYIYTGGQEDGVIIGIRNYPRFPSSKKKLKKLAIRLADGLMEYLCQRSCLIYGPQTNIWRTRDEKTSQQHS